MLFWSGKSSCEHRSGSFVPVRAKECSNKHKSGGFVLGPVWKSLGAMVIAAFLAVSCGEEPVVPKDTKAPVITVSTSTVNVIAAPEATVSGSELKIGATSVASWKDDMSATCTVEVNLTPTTGIAKAVKT